MRTRTHLLRHYTNLRLLRACLFGFLAVLRNLAEQNAQLVDLAFFLVDEVRRLGCHPSPTHGDESRIVRIAKAVA